MPTRATTSQATPWTNQRERANRRLSSRTLKSPIAVCRLQRAVRVPRRTHPTLISSEVASRKSQSSRSAPGLVFYWLPVVGCWPPPIASRPIPTDICALSRIRLGRVPLPVTQPRCPNMKWSCRGGWRSWKGNSRLVAQRSIPSTLVKVSDGHECSRRGISRRKATRSGAHRSCPCMGSANFQSRNEVPSEYTRPTTARPTPPTMDTAPLLWPPSLPGLLLLPDPQNPGVLLPRPFPRIYLPLAGPWPSIDRQCCSTIRSSSAQQ